MMRSSVCPLHGIRAAAGQLAHAVLLVVTFSHIFFALKFMMRLMDFANCAIPRGP
jgi:hypothetical protein